jgi:hypothetical protein
VIAVKEPGMSHMSFSDVPLLSAFGDRAKETEATRCLHDLGGVVISFFDRFMENGSSRSKDFLTQRNPDITVMAYGPR